MEKKNAQICSTRLLPSSLNNGRATVFPPHRVYCSRTASSVRAAEMYYFVITVVSESRRAASNANSRLTLTRSRANTRNDITFWSLRATSRRSFPSRQERTKESTWRGSASAHRKRDRARKTGRIGRAAGLISGRINFQVAKSRSRANRLWRGSAGGRREREREDIHINVALGRK